MNVKELDNLKKELSEAVVVPKSNQQWSMGDEPSTTTVPKKSASIKKPTSKKTPKKSVPIQPQTGTTVYQPSQTQTGTTVSQPSQAQTQTYVAQPTQTAPTQAPKTVQPKQSFFQKAQGIAGKAIDAAGRAKGAIQGIKQVGSDIGSRYAQAQKQGAQNTQNWLSNLTGKQINTTQIKGSLRKVADQLKTSQGSDQQLGQEMDTLLRKYKLEENKMIKKSQIKFIIKECIKAYIKENLEEAEIKIDKLSNSERNKISMAFKKLGLDGNGRFEKKEHGLRAVSEALQSLGFQLDMVSGDIIMGDKGQRNLIFRRVNSPGQDQFSENPEIRNSRIAFVWELMDRPPSPKFEILAYAS